jgi:hypothetical protein
MGLASGSIVVWKAEFAETEEERTRPLVVLEPANDGRCYIRPADWDVESQGPIVPTQMVRMEWLEPIPARP